MNIEKDLVIAILKLTKNASVSNDLIIKESKTSSVIGHKLIGKLHNHGLVYLKDKVIVVNSAKRLKLAFHALQLGADLERVSRFLDWKEFESIAAVAFGRNQYVVQKNLRFKSSERRWEIDIVGSKKPFVVCVDCKHWRYGMYPSAVRRVVEAQVKRTSALADCMPRLADEIGCTLWSKIKLVPTILSLATARCRFYEGVPIVSVLQLQDFLGQLPAYANSMKHFLVQNLPD